MMTHTIMRPLDYVDYIILKEILYRPTILNFLNHNFVSFPRGHFSLSGYIFGLHLRSGASYCHRMEEGREVANILHSE